MSTPNKLRGYVALTSEFRAGRSSPRAYLDETLARIAQLDPEIGAFVAMNREGAIRAAEASTARWRDGKPLSPIDGMPVAIKDIIETADMPTGQGSPMFEGADWQRDSASVHALREAGAIIIGKTTTTEFAPAIRGTRPRTRTTATRTPGGSSSGSAAAVGAGMVPAALGTQVVGSILRPASFCGAIGFKPSVGAINRSGSHDHFSQSCQGAIGATLADTWAVLRAIADRAGGDPGFVGLTGDVDFAQARQAAQLGVLETGGWSATTEGARKAFAEAKRASQAHGVELQEPRRRSRHRSGREGDCRCAAADAGHQRLGRPLAAQHLRRPRREQAQPGGARPAEDRGGDDATAVRRTAEARASPRARPMPRPRAIRRVRDARRVRRGAGRAGLDRQHRR